VEAIELYEFTLYSTTWRYTSSGAPVTHDGEVYAVLSGLSRGAVEHTGDASRVEHKVTMPVGVGPAALFSNGTPDGVLQLRLLRLEDGVAEVTWVGRIVGCTFAGSVATLTGEPVFSTVKAPGLSWFFTPSCQHDFCDLRCVSPDNNGNYSPNRAYADGATAVFDPGMYFYSGAADLDSPPAQMWDEDPATVGAVTGMDSDSVITGAYKENLWEEEIEGCTHTHEVYESFSYEEGVWTYHFESYEYWECPSYEEIYISYSATEDEEGVAHYVQTDPEAATWDDPDGLPPLDGFTLEGKSSIWQRKDKHQNYQETIGGYVHTFVINEMLENHIDYLRYTYESTESWDDGDYHEVRTYYQGTQNAGETFAEYQQSSPEEAYWTDPDGLPALDDYTGIVYYGSGNFRAGITYAQAREVAVVAMYGGNAGEGLFVQSSTDGETWETVPSSILTGASSHWILYNVGPSAGRLHWAVLSTDPLLLAGLKFFTRQEYEDCRASVVAPSSVSAIGTVSGSHPLSHITDGLASTYGEVTGAGCAVVFDMGSPVSLVAITLVPPVVEDGSGYCLAYSDDNSAWYLADSPNNNLENPLAYSVVHDFGKHRWWAVLGTAGFVRLSSVILYKRGRLISEDEARFRTVWADGSVWELDGEVTAVSGATVTVDGLSSKADGFFTGGLLLSNEGARAVVSHAGNVLTLSRPMGSLAVGTMVSVRAGCDKTKETCNARGNIPNHSGWPFIPEKNPMADDTIY
jgi:hypothetical protein